MLADQSSPDDLVSGRRSCALPAVVHDARYEPGSLKHIFALHNHPFGTRLSARDLRFIEEMAGIHAWEVATKGGKVRLSIIAFFSRSKDASAPTCDGFYQYIPATREMLMWSVRQGQWTRETYGSVTSVNERSYRIDEQ